MKAGRVKTDSDSPESKEDKLESGQKGHWEAASVNTSRHPVKKWIEFESVQNGSLQNSMGPVKIQG